MSNKRKPKLNRRAALGLVALGLPTLSTGCFSPWFAGGPEMSPQQKRRERIKETLKSDKRPQILGEIAIEQMLTLAPLQNVGLVTGLVGTGGKVKPSQPRKRMLATMAINEAATPNILLDDPGTTMVIAKANVPPAARKGTSLDVIVNLSAHAEATDLARGWLMETSLVEMSRLGGQIREGFKYASAEGQVVTVAQVTGSENPADKLKGSVIGGARLLKQRELGIGIHQEFADAVTLAAILPKINDRFTTFDGSKHVGIATPTPESNIRLIVPPRYELDSYHFVNVVLQIGFGEQPNELEERIDMLTRQLREPTTVRRACWQLEAIGERTIPMLMAALDSPNSEVRFYVAHSLAYLDDRRAIVPLVQLCRQEPAFRAMCLNGLSVISHYEAEDALRELLHSADAECRYGAVRALRVRDERDAQVTSTMVGETGRILEIPSQAPPLVAVSLTQVPEIVIFGSNPNVILPEFEYVTERMIIRKEEGELVTINHFEPGAEDRVVQTTTDLRSLLEGIAEVGGTYGDWISFLRTCSEKSYLAEPVAMNPVPQSGRTYDRQPQSEFEPGERGNEETFVDTAPSIDVDEDSAWYNPFSW